MLGQILVTKQTGPQGKIVSKVRNIRSSLVPLNLFAIISVTDIVIMVTPTLTLVICAI